jgi:uncharacterized protein (TIGR00369 family)
MKPNLDIVGLVPLEEVRLLSGLELLRGMIDGRLPPPPVSKAANIWLSDADHGRVVFEGEPGEAFFNPMGTVHGGWTGTILDSAMACAVHSTLAAEQAYTTVEMKVNFVRAVMPGGGLVRCEGRVVHGGRRIATSEGFLRSHDGKLLAHGTETCLIVDLAAST